MVAGRPELFAAEIGGAAIGYSDLLPVSLSGTRVIDQGTAKGMVERAHVDTWNTQLGIGAG